MKIIAEAGVNHNGSLEMAFQLIDTAVAAGADVVKFQTFRADKLVTKTAPKAGYQKIAIGSEESQHAMLKKLELSEKAHRALWDYCQKKGIVFLSTPFDEESADFLESLGVTCFKIPSGEITNLSFLEHIAQKKKPMIVSTGMATLEEVGAAVKTIQKAGNHEITLLQCVSNYPADPADCNLKAMETMRQAFQLPVGFSDHTLGIETTLAAAALGATIIEKHFTLDKNLHGPDHKASLNPAELTALVRGVRIVEKALGHGRKEPATSEKETALVTRKSLVAAKGIPAGVCIEKDFIAVKRPGNGLSPAMLTEIIGLKTRRKINEGEVLTLEMFQS